MSYLHDLAELYRNEPQDRRREEWSAVRGHLDILISTFSIAYPDMSHAVIRKIAISSFTAGYKIAANVAFPKRNQ